MLVSRPTGEGTGFSVFHFAAAALTRPYARSDLQGPATRARVTLGVRAQRATTGRARHGLRVRLPVSAAVTAGDLLANTATATTAGRLR